MPVVPVDNIVVRSLVVVRVDNVVVLAHPKICVEYSGLVIPYHCGDWVGLMCCPVHAWMPIALCIALMLVKVVTRHHVFIQMVEQIFSNLTECDLGYLFRCAGFSYQSGQRHDKCFCSVLNFLNSTA